MNHLQFCCGGLPVLNFVELTPEMITYYIDAVGIPKYINILRGAKKNSHQAQLLTLNVTLVYITTKYIPQSQAFTPKIKEW